MRHFCLCIGLAFVLAGCNRSGKETTLIPEQTHVRCSSPDQICEGDVLPPFDAKTESLFKLNGKWFVVPREYGGYGGALAFFWPSKVPANSWTARKDAPEFIPSGPHRLSNFYDVAIEIFLRTNHLPPQGPPRFKALQIAEAQGRVLAKRHVKPGLEAWLVQDEIKGLPPAMWYIATNLKDANGEPPVLGCFNTEPKVGSCTMAFRWQQEISADLRFNPMHAEDWPEIYQEVVRILNLIKEA